MATNYPTSLDVKGSSLFDISDKQEAQLSAAMDSTQTTVYLDSVSMYFVYGGIAWIEEEMIKYTSIDTDAKTLTGVTRGYGGTTPVTHATALPVQNRLTSFHTNNLLDATIAIQTVLGITGGVMTLDRQVTISPTSLSGVPLTLNLPTGSTSKKWISFQSNSIEKGSINWDPIGNDIDFNGLALSIAGTSSLTLEDNRSLNFGTDLDFDIKFVSSSTSGWLQDSDRMRVIPPGLSGTDITTLLQAAILGGEVFIKFPPGTFQVSKLLIEDVNNITIEGAGPTLTNIEAIGNAPSNDAWVELHADATASVSKIVLRDLRLSVKSTTTPAGAALISFRGARNCRLDNVFLDCNGKVAKAYVFDGSDEPNRFNTFIDVYAFSSVDPNYMARMTGDCTVNHFLNCTLFDNDVGDLLELDGADVAFNTWIGLVCETGENLIDIQGAQENRFFSTYLERGRLRAVNINAAASGGSIRNQFIGSIAVDAELPTYPNTVPPYDELAITQTVWQDRTQYSIAMDTTFRSGALTVDAVLATALSTFKNADLHVRAHYWDGASDTIRDASIRHRVTATTPTSQWDILINSVLLASFYDTKAIQFFGQQIDFGQANAIATLQNRSAGNATRGFIAFNADAASALDLGAITYTTEGARPHTFAVGRIYSKVELSFEDTLNNKGEIITLRGKNHATTGPSSIELISRLTNTPTVLWVRPNGTPSNGTDTGYFVIDQGLPFSVAASAYFLVAIDHDGAGGGHYSLGTKEENGGTAKDIWVYAANQVYAKLLRVGDFGQRAWQHTRSVEFQDANDAAGASAGIEHLLLNRLRRSTSTQSGLSWEIRFRSYAYDTNVATEGQKVRDIRIVMEGELGDSTIGDLPYSLNFKDNGNVTFAYFAPRIGLVNRALLDLRPAAQVIPTLSSTTAGLRLSQTTYTLGGTLGTFAFVAVEAPTLTKAGAVTVTDASTVYIQGPPIAGGALAFTNLYALWVDAGDVRFDGTIIWRSTTTQNGIFTHGNTATRTWSFPDADGTIPLLNLAQTWSALQTFTADVDMGASNVIKTIQARSASATARGYIKFDAGVAGALSLGAILINGEGGSTVHINTISGSVNLGALQIASKAMTFQNADQTIASTTLAQSWSAVAQTFAAGASFIFATAGAGFQLGTGATQLLGFWGATAVVRPSAYTQTYSTADKTLSAYTSDPESSVYTGIDNAQAGTPYATVTDLNALRVAYENLRVFTEDAVAMLNAIVDDQQSMGLVG